MRIFIPTYGRSDRQVTWDNLPDRARMNTSLVVQDRERGKYEYFPSVKVLPPEITTIGPTRQWLIDNIGSNFVMLDDDLDFAVRREDEPTKFRPASDVDVLRMLNEIRDMLMERHPLVGISAREGANYDTSQHKCCTRQMRVHGVNPSMFRAKGVRFDRVEFMEDFDVILQWLELGYPNWVLNGYVHNQRGGSNAPGGCSTTRTLEKHNEAAKHLQQLHPRFVRIVEKESGNWGGARLDVNVSWKKAYESSQTTEGLV